MSAMSNKNIALYTNESTYVILNFLVSKLKNKKQVKLILIMCFN